MPSNYKANDPYVNEQVDLDDIFITDAWLVDQFVGGTLFGWGSGAWGNMGIGAAGPQGFVYYSSPVQVGSLTNWKQVSCAVSTTGAVKTDGTLWMWGQQYYGQLGNGTTADVRYSSPIQIGSLTNWKQVSLGIYHTAAVKTDGTLWTWGAGTQNFGQLGVGNLIQYYSPVQVGSLYNWKQVSGKGSYTAAVKTDGTLWTWGRNDSGQLGNGTTINYSSPIQIGSLTNWKQVDSALHTAAIKTDGTLWAWGDNSYGKLGLGDSPFAARFGTTGVSSPVQVAGGNTWLGTDPDTLIIASGVGFYGANLIKGDGTLWSWGDNTNGQVGNGLYNIHYSSPIQIGSLTNWKRISSGFRHTTAVKTDGTLWAWGANSQGALGTGNTTWQAEPYQVGALTNWEQTASGGATNETFTAAVKTDGTLWAWGFNLYGQLGNGTRAYYSSPIQIGSLTNWKQVSASYIGHTVAIKTDGTLWAWGYNVGGQVGNFTTLNYYSSPIQIGSLTNWKQVSAGFNHTAAIKTDGTLWAWGLNSQGQLGQGDTNQSNGPVQVGVLTNWKQVSVGTNFTMAAKTDGTLWAWGQNGGVLGNGTTINYSSPIQIGSLTNWKQVSSLYFGWYAYKTDGSLWSCGYNSFGQLGAPIDNLSSFSSPIQVGALTNWKQIVVSSYQTAAIKTDGTLWTWGYNQYGGLGNGTTILYSSPIQVGSLTNWKQVACGYSHVSAIKTDGTLWAWGRNDTSTGGQLGNGTTISYSSPIQVGLLTNWKQVDGSRTTFAITFKDIT